MWTNLKFLHIWHVCDVENASTCVKFMLFCCKIGFVAIYALISQNLFVAIFALLKFDKYESFGIVRTVWGCPDSFCVIQTVLVWI